MAITKVTNRVLEVDSVGTAQLSAGAVTESKIANSAVTLAKLAQPFTLATVKAFNWNGSSTNTFLDFTNIPSWAKLIIVMFNELSLNGSNISVRLGTSSGIENTNYIAGSSRVGPLGATAYAGSTVGFNVQGGTGAENFSGIMHLSTLGSNVWSASHAGRVAAGSIQGGGTKTLAGTLTQVRITTETTTNIVDAGSVNISYC
jgi:hypothetical protein